MRYGAIYTLVFIIWRLRHQGIKKQYIIPIFVPHLGCPNDCVFCNQKSISGQTKQVTKEDVKNIIEAANITKADSVHPGFGFLSENSQFAKICEESNIKFIGPSKEIINSILKDKSKISMPILSEEQKDVNEQKLLIAYYSKSKINISYYQNGNINLINSYIKKIDFTYHKIYFENNTILFDQIVSLN